MDAKRGTVHSTYREFDKRSKWKLSKSEFERVVTNQIGVVCSPEQLSMIFDWMDCDGDGHIQYKELLHCVQEYDHMEYERLQELRKPTSNPVQPSDSTPAELDSPNHVSAYDFEHTIYQNRPAAYRIDGGGAYARWSRFRRPTG